MHMQFSHGQSTSASPVVVPPRTYCPPDRVVCIAPDEEALPLPFGWIPLLAVQTPDPTALPLPFGWKPRSKRTGAQRKRAVFEAAKRQGLGRMEPNLKLLAALESIQARSSNEPIPRPRCQSWQHCQARSDAQCLHCGNSFCIQCLPNHIWARHQEIQNIFQ